MVNGNFTKENKKVKDTNPEGSSVAVSSLWFTVSGEDLKDRAKSRKNTERIVFTGRGPRSPYFHYT